MTPATGPLVRHFRKKDKRRVDLDHWIPEYAHGEPMARLHSANPSKPNYLNRVDLAKLFAIQKLG